CWGYTEAGDRCSCLWHPPPRLLTQDSQDTRTFPACASGTQTAAVTACRSYCFTQTQATLTAGSTTLRALSRRGIELSRSIAVDGAAAGRIRTPVLSRAPSRMIYTLWWSTWGSTDFISSAWRAAD